MNQYINELQNKISHEFNPEVNDNGKLSPSQWTEKYTNIFNRKTGIVTNYSFEKHHFQKEIIDDMHHDIVVKKCCQLGLTEVAVRKALYLTAYKGLTTILTQPNFMAMRGFSKARIAPVIDGSDWILNRINRTDSVDLKNIGDGFLYVRYTEGAENNALSIPADAIVSDEVDQSNQDRLSLFNSRLESSVHGYKFKFGTPTIDAFGVSALYDTSNQHEYHIKCPHCNQWNQMTYKNLINFPYELLETGDTRFGHTYDGELLECLKSVYIGCLKCGGSLEYGDDVLTPKLSNKLTPVRPTYQWVSQYDPSTSTFDKNRAKGYYINQMATGLKTGRNIVDSMRQLKETRHIYNQIFGLGFTSSTESVTEGDLTFLDFDIKPRFSFLGLDFGKKKSHAFTITYDAKEGLFIPFNLYELPLYTIDNANFLVDEVNKICKKDGVICGVVDALPYSDLVNRLKVNGSCVILESYLTDKERAFFKINEKDLIVRGRRTSNIDNMLVGIKNDNIQFSKSLIPQRSLISSHFINFKKLEKIDGSSYYPKIGEDHLGFALMYAMQAVTVANEYRSVINKKMPKFGFKISKETCNI